MNPSQTSADVRYSSRTIAGGSLGSTQPLAGGCVVYKLVRTSRLYEQIVQQSEESIVKGNLKPGDQLPAEAGHIASPRVPHEHRHRQHDQDERHELPGLGVVFEKQELCFGAHEAEHEHTENLAAKP